MTKHTGAMTERKWLACSEPQPMLAFLRDTASERKLRLLACALGRHFWDRIDQDEGRRTLEFAETVAEGEVQATPDQLYEAWTAAANVWITQRGGTATKMAVDCAMVSGWSAAANVASSAKRTGLRKGGVANLLREVFGNPFRGIALDPARLPPSVLSLAASVYRERALPSGHLDNDRLAVLADALKDAGYDDAEMLSHLRSPGPHVRGCWALDLVLDKE